jgi:hypothetical protein
LPPWATISRNHSPCIVYGVKIMSQYCSNETCVKSWSVSTIREDLSGGV